MTRSRVPNGDARRTEIEAEIADHLARDAERIIADEGIGREDAEKRALKRFGDVHAATDACLRIARSPERRRRLGLFGAGLALVAGLGWWAPTLQDAKPAAPVVLGAVQRMGPERLAESRLYRLKQRADWASVLVNASRHAQDTSLASATRAYASLSLVQANRALGQPEQPAWLTYRSLNADLSCRSDIAWLARRLQHSSPVAEPRSTASGLVPGDSRTEGRLFRLKRDARWRQLLGACSEVLASETAPSVTRSYAALCEVVARRSTGQGEEPAWARYRDLDSDLTARPDLEWFARRLKKQQG